MLFQSFLLAFFFFAQAFPNLLLQLVDFVLLFGTVIFKLVFVQFALGSVLFCLESFAHTEGHRTFVEGLVGLDGHFDLIAHAHQ